MQGQQERGRRSLALWKGKQGSTEEDPPSFVSDSSERFNAVKPFRKGCNVVWKPC